MPVSRPLRKWQLLLLSLGTFTLGKVSTMEEVSLSRDHHTVRKPKLATWREREKCSAVLAKPSQAPNMQFKKPSWKFQPWQMLHGEKLRKPAKTKTQGSDIWPQISYPSDLQLFKLKSHSTVK